MNTDEKKALGMLLAETIAADAGAGGYTDGELESAIWDRLKNAPEAPELSFSEKTDLVREIFSDMRGCGVLDRLLEDADITEIMVNGPDRIFYEKDGRTFDSGLRFESEKKLTDVIQRIVGNAGREINTANPIVDTRLADGSRVSAVLPPVSLSGPVLTVRRFPAEAMSLSRLISLGAVSEEAARSLAVLVRAGYNIFISGGTGSGKTSLLNALSGAIPPEERVVTVEDSAELKITGIRNLVRLETRNANSSGNGKITVRSLIRASLRMRPDRIIVGEIRGPEALDMLQAMNTGHDGSLSTGHANSPADMISRMETMVLEGGEGLPLTAVRQQIASAVDIIVHLSRLRDRSRRIVEIDEVDGLQEGCVRLNPLFVFRETDAGGDTVQGSLCRTDRPLRHREKLEKKGLTEFR